MNDIERVSIYWSEPILYSELGESRNRWYDVFYKISSGTEVMYIGLAYKKHVKRILKNHHKLESIVENEGESEVRISFGEYVVKEGRRMSKNRVYEIENLLIYKYKPPYNRQSHETYGGRYLIIYNSGPGNLFDSVDTPSSFDENHWDLD